MVLLLGDETDLIGNFGEVLILAENKRDIVHSAMGQANDIERKTDIDALLLRDEKDMLTSVWQSDSLVSITERA